MEFGLNIPLRGTRDYLQSIDIFRAVVDVIENKFGRISALRIKFSILARSKLRLIFSSVESIPPVECCAKIWCTIDDVSYVGYLFETGEAVDDTIIGNEATVSNSVQIINETAVVPLIDGVDFIERLVFGTKILHYTNFPISNGKWIVAEIRIDDMLTSTKNNAIFIEKILIAQNRITDCRIIDGENKIGSIRFIVIN